MNSIDAQEELERMLSEELSKNIDMEIFKDLSRKIKTTDRNTKLKKIVSKIQKLNLLNNSRNRR